MYGTEDSTVQFVPLPQSAISCGDAKRSAEEIERLNVRINIRRYEVVLQFMLRRRIWGGGINDEVEDGCLPTSLELTNFHSRSNCHSPPFFPVSKIPLKPFC